MDPSFETAIGNLEKGNTTSGLFLRNCKIDVAACERLGQAVRGNTTLKALSLSYNPSMGDQGVVNVMDGLSGNQSLTGLGLVDTGMESSCDGFFVGSCRPHWCT